MHVTLIREAIQQEEESEGEAEVPVAFRESAGAANDMEERPLGEMRGRGKKGEEGEKKQSSQALVREKMREALHACAEEVRGLIKRVGEESGGRRATERARRQRWRDREMEEERIRQENLTEEERQAEQRSGERRERRLGRGAVGLDDCRAGRMIRATCSTRRSASPVGSNAAIRTARSARETKTSCPHANSKPEMLHDACVTVTLTLVTLTLGRREGVPPGFFLPQLGDPQCRHG